LSNDENIFKTLAQMTIPPEALKFFGNRKSQYF